jgi:hypothetical protein
LCVIKLCDDKWREDKVWMSCVCDQVV